MDHHFDVVIIGTGAGGATSGPPACPFRIKDPDFGAGRLCSPRESQLEFAGG